MHTFLFGTRLTNITRHLRHRDVDVALSAVSQAVADWSGGTRIGASLATFNLRWSRRVLGQNAVVLLISDGLDRDGGADLSQAMDRLHRSCRKLIWLNPLLRYDDFRPVATGVRLMLPHVDAFLPAHNLDSLVDLARALAPGRSQPVFQKEIRSMDMTGERYIPLPQQRVWEALNDPEVLKACIPGCDSIEKQSDTEYKVAMTAAVGPVKAKFSGKLQLSDLHPPNSYSLSFEGSGGAAGFGKGSAQVSLAPAAGGTKLAYTAKATVGGKLAQVGSRLIDAASRKMADDFFSRFNETIAPPATGRRGGAGAEEAGSALGVGRSRDRRGCADRVLGAARSLTTKFKAYISPQRRGGAEERREQQTELEPPSLASTRSGMARSR